VIIIQKIDLIIFKYFNLEADCTNSLKKNYLLVKKLLAPAVIPANIDFNPPLIL
jgi:hypothetical protein